MSQGTAQVAEYQRLAYGVLFRVVNVPGYGIVYVLRGQDGVLTAETFEGQRMHVVPPDARHAVESYQDPSGKL
jgi:hypothetical protein